MIAVIEPLKIKSLLQGERICTIHTTMGPYEFFAGLSRSCITNESETLLVSSR